MSTETRPNSTGFGVFEADVADVETAAGCRFPAEYRDFLLMLGNRCPVLPSDLSFAVSDLPSIRKQAEMQLKEAESPYTLGSEDHVFAMDSNGNFLMFRLSDGDAPKVLSFCEAGVNPVPTDESFSEWLESTASD